MIWKFSENIFATKKTFKLVDTEGVFVWEPDLISIDGNDLGIIKSYILFRTPIYQYLYFVSIGLSFPFFSYLTSAIVFKLIYPNNIIFNILSFVSCFHALFVIFLFINIFYDSIIHKSTILSQLLISGEIYFYSLFGPFNLIFKIPAFSKLYVFFFWNIVLNLLTSYFYLTSSSILQDFIEQIAHVNFKVLMIFIQILLLILDYMKDVVEEYRSKYRKYLKEIVKILQNDFNVDRSSWTSDVDYSRNENIAKKVRMTGEPRRLDPTERILETNHVILFYDENGKRLLSSNFFFQFLEQIQNESLIWVILKETYFFLIRMFFPIFIAVQFFYVFKIDFWKFDSDEFKFLSFTLIGQLYSKFFLKRKQTDSDMSTNNAFIGRFSNFLLKYREKVQQYDKEVWQGNVGNRYNNFSLFF